ncbi:hypothetical protein CDO73_12135 [Saccharibacillus sp. O23]|uniref:hypothetical protein n=1 Tax=Saccharibacillus sp. O23 TaxID=2009338 RepID=UPI000B4E46C5|nr:hypothetical protein [Saccharibacillus sp. O23]OWR29829.1 hypothetical protein CDO73_12135 [Saccharibacillus sp. O23]
MIESRTKEVLKRLIYTYSDIPLPLSNSLWNPDDAELLKRIGLFDGSYSLAASIEDILLEHRCVMKFGDRVRLANRIWAAAYPNYPYKVAWHEGCQGYFEIWKELATNRFYLECDECSIQVDSPEDLTRHKASERFYGLSVYPTVEELKAIDWFKLIL